MPVRIHYLPPWVVSEILHKDIGNIDFSTEQTIISKIQEHFGDQIKTFYYIKKASTVIFEASLNNEKLLSLPKSDPETAAAADSTILLKAARSPQQLLLAVKITCDPLPNVFTSQFFQIDQVSFLDKCTKFCMGRLCVNPSELTEKDRRLASSFGSDLLFNVTKSHVKPAKQMVIRLSIKSIAGSEKVCKIQHQFGHDISC